MPFNQHHPVICFGEILWDELPAGRKPGGAPVNVAYHLQMLQKNPAVISRVGTDAEGDALLEIFSGKGISTTYVQKDPLKRTSIVRAEQKGNHEMVYTIVEDVAWDYITLSEELEQLVRDADYLVFGTLAARSNRSYETISRLLLNARNRVLDLNLRAPFYNRGLVEYVLEMANIVKMNGAELELVAAWFGKVGSYGYMMRSVAERFKLDMLVVTKGSEGAALLQGETITECTGLPVRVADTVGSGDAFLAAVISGIMERKPVTDVLDFANTLAAFVTTQHGACPYYEPGKINDLLQEHMQSPR